MTYTDQEYLEGLIKNKSVVIEAMIKNYYPRVKNYILRNNGNEEEAKDLFFEAIYILHRKLIKEDFILTSQLYTYIQGIINNKWLERNQKIKYARENEEAVKQKLIERDYSINHAEILKGIGGEVIDINEDRLLLVKTKFKQLEEKCQKVLKLFFMKYKMIEIGDRMGWQASTTKKEKALCQKRLVEMIISDAQFLDLYNNRSKQNKTNNLL